MQQDQQLTPEQKKELLKAARRTSITGCLYITLLIILLTIGVKECKRADYRLERERIKYENTLDSIKNINR